MNEANEKYKTKDIGWISRIHFEIEKDNNKYYLCNRAVNTFPSKRTNDKSKVTCMNCLNYLKKHKKEND